MKCSSYEIMEVLEVVYMISMDLQPLHQIISTIPNYLSVITKVLEECLDRDSMTGTLCCIVRDTIKDLDTSSSDVREQIISFLPRWYEKLFDSVSRELIMPHDLCSCCDVLRMLYDIQLPSKEQTEKNGIVWMERLMMILIRNKRSDHIVVALCNLMRYVIGKADPISISPQVLHGYIQHIHSHLDMLIDLLKRFSSHREVIYSVIQLINQVVSDAVQMGYIRDPAIRLKQHEGLFLLLRTKLEGSNDVVKAFDKLILLCKNGQVSTSSSTTEILIDSTVSLSTTPISLNALPVLEFANSEVCAIRQVSCHVYEGSWKQSHVAIKLIHSKDSEELAQLATLRHPRIVFLYGFCHDISLLSNVDSKECHQVGLILEWMTKGSLREVLTTEHSQMTWIDKLTIAVDVSDAMRFLHQTKLIHGKLISENVLLDDKGRAKLNVFSAPHSSSTTGIAPDALQAEFQIAFSNKNTGKKNNKKKGHEKSMLVASTSTATLATVALTDDIYNFGIIMWELITGKHHLHSTKPCLTEQEKELTPPVMVTYFDKCLNTDPTCRPSFSEIFDSMSTFLAQETKSYEQRKRTIPDGFLCPITQDLLNDPVMLLDGHTYERKAIVDWLKRSDRSPLTNEVLPATTMLDNYALKSAIENFLLLNPRFKGKK